MVAQQVVSSSLSDFSLVPWKQNGRAFSKTRPNIGHMSANTAALRTQTTDWVRVSIGGGNSQYTSNRREAVIRTALRVCAND